MSARSYLILALSIAVTLCVAVVSFNEGVDPYRLRMTSISETVSGAGELKRPGAFLRQSQLVRIVQPRSVVIGTSRAQSGIDVSHPGFRQDELPVMNLALGALGIEQSRLLLVHAHSSSGLRKAVIGLDLEAFLDAGRPDFDTSALDGNPTSEPHWLVRIRIDMSRSTLAAALTEVLGLDAPPLDLALRQQLERHEGQRGVIWATEFNNFYSRLPVLFPRSVQPNPWQSDSRKRATLQSFRRLIDFGRSNGIDLRFFISPVHARYLDWYRHVGWWPMFEQWKRELVAALAEEAQERPDRKPYPLWDFSGFHSVSTEDVPLPGDLAGRMSWYLETSHYSPATGRLILDRMFGLRPGEVSLLPDGRIHQGNIERHLAGLLLEADRYRAEHPGEAANVRAMVGYLRRIARK